MEQKKKLNFWQLCWKRYSGGHANFFEMFKHMTMELDERRRVNWVAIRTIIQTVAILVMCGIIIFVLHWIYPHSTAINRILIIGPIVALGVITIVLYHAYHLSKGFAYYVEHHNKFTSGGGYYDVSSMLDEINPIKQITKLVKKMFH